MVALGHEDNGGGDGVVTMMTMIVAEWMGWGIGREKGGELVLKSGR